MKDIQIYSYNKPLFLHQIIQQIKKFRTTCDKHNITVLKCSHSEAIGIESKLS